MSVDGESWAGKLRTRNGQETDKNGPKTERKWTRKRTENGHHKFPQNAQNAGCEPFWVRFRSVFGPFSLRFRSVFGPFLIRVELASKSSREIEWRLCREFQYTEVFIAGTTWASLLSHKANVATFNGEGGGFLCCSNSTQRSYGGSPTPLKR